MNYNKRFSYGGPMQSKEKPASSGNQSKVKVTLTNSNLKSFDAENVNQNVSFGDDTVLFSVEPLVKPKANN